MPVFLSDEQFDRMMRAVRFVESMQRGPVRGQEAPQRSVHPPAPEVWIKVTGPVDAAFKPEDTETVYYPCVLTEKFVLTDEEETEYGPLASYWHDYDGVDDEEFRVFAMNGGTLTEGDRYKATVINQQDNQYAVMGVQDGGSGVEAIESTCLVTLTVGGEDYIVPSAADDCDLTLTSTDCVVSLKRGDVTLGSVNIETCIDARLQELCRSKEVVIDVECDEEEITPTFFTLDYVTCPSGGDP